MDKQITKKQITASGLLIALCWLAYACSLVGKVNYAASITQVELFFGVSHAEAGIVSTFYFFAYGTGQIINGIFSKRYNLKYVIFGSLLLSGVFNLVVGITDSFAVIKWVWLLNGICVSALWPCIIRLLSETLSKRQMVKASVVMGTSTATGTLIAYGLSSLFTALSIFRFSFYTAALLLPIGGILWLCAFSKLTKKAREEGIREDEEDGVAVVQAPVAAEKTRKRGIPRDLLIITVLLAVFAVTGNFIKDGLTTWVPSILKEEYGLSASLSILLTLFLPVLNIFGNLFANKLYKRLGDFIVVCGVLFLGATALTGCVIGSLSLKTAVITLCAFAFTCFLSSATHSAIVSVFPLQMKEKVNSGMMAGLMNGFSYVGSALSSYGLGAVADAWGWTTVFWLLFCICATSTVIAVVYKVVKIFVKK